MKKTLYYIYDPMCAWCYAFEQTFEHVKEKLNDDFEVVYIPGGLAPHSDITMPKAMQEKIQSIWYQITQVVGSKFNHDFWTKCTPRRSTYLACQATVAARLQNKEEAMIKAIQKAYYQEALNPSDESTLVQAAKTIGLDVDKFQKDLTSNEVIALFENDLNHRRKLGVNGFPTLLLQYKKECYPINIEYNNPSKMLAQIKDLSENIYF